MQFERFSFRSIFQRILPTDIRHNRPLDFRSVIGSSIRVNRRSR